MPQAAVAAIGAYLTAAIAASGYAFFVQAFLYVATSYLLKRASDALTPRQRSPGLGTSAGTTLYLPDAKTVLGTPYAG
jgi:hypothetical protein